MASEAQQRELVTFKDRGVFFHYDPVTIDEYAKQYQPYSTPIIIDLGLKTLSNYEIQQFAGSHEIRAGWATDAAPRCAFTFSIFANFWRFVCSAVRFMPVVGRSKTQKDAQFPFIGHHVRASRVLLLMLMCVSLVVRTRSCGSRSVFVVVRRSRTTSSSISICWCGLCCCLRVFCLCWCAIIGCACFLVSFVLVVACGRRSQCK